MKRAFLFVFVPIWAGLAILMTAQVALAAPAPSDDCQRAAFAAASGTIPSSAKMTGVISLASAPAAQDRSVSSVVLLGQNMGFEFSIVVHVRYLRNPHECQILQVDNLDWGDHI